MRHDHNLSPPASLPDSIEEIRKRTPARIFVDRGTAYSTQMELELRRAHASAVDAVWREFELEKDLPQELVAQWKLFQVSSRAGSKSQFLLCPHLGRRLPDDAKSLITQKCPVASDFQIVIGDGLSGAAVSEQIPALFPLLQERACSRRWSIGHSFAVRYCRVGIMNEIGDLLAPRVLVLLIGERPGLATAESLSAYMAYQPRSGHTDANRNLVSNIHARGVRVVDALDRITNLAARMIATKCSGASLKEGTEILPV